MRRAVLPVLITLLTLSTNSFAAVKVTKGEWLSKVPPENRERANPLAADRDAVPAGRHIYQMNCAKCHGEDASGRGRRPSLRTQRVHDATDGELHWLLTNGALSKGMPAWSGLPDAQRWQLARYLHSLPLASPTPAAGS